MSPLASPTCTEYLLTLCREDLRSALPFMVLGAFLLAGYLAHVLGRRTHVPRVTLLLLLGALAGPHGLHLVPEMVAGWFPFFAQLALSMIGFMLGEQFLGKSLHNHRRTVLSVALAETLGAGFAVAAGLWAAGVSPALSLLLGGVAPASAPAATVDVIHENGARGPVSKLVLAVVAIDDVFAIMLFSLFIAIAQVIEGGTFSFGELGHSAWELGGAVAVGGLLGLPMAWLTGRVRRGEPTLVETLGFVLLCSGAASAAGASYLLACIVLGAVVANRAQHHSRPFHAIEGISQPFLIAFFLLAGFELDVRALQGIGLVALGYVVLRVAGKLVGARLGAHLAQAPPVVKRYTGYCLLPQAGVALGLGLMAAERFPEHGRSLLSLLVATTFLFEVLGPVSTRVALERAGELRRAR